MLSYVLPAADVGRLITTQRYWMLHNLDPAGKTPVLAVLMELELSEKIRLLDEAAKSLAHESYRFSHADLVIVPDTNVLLHHSQSIEHIRWAELAPAGAKRVIVAVPILVVDELDAAKKRGDKIESGKEAVRTRARRTLAVLERWFQAGLSSVLPGTSPVIEVVLVLDEPDRPRLLDADYEIIDTAGAIRDLSGTSVVIATRDSGMRLRAKAAGVDARELQDVGEV